MRLRPAPSPTMHKDWKDWAEALLSWLRISLGRLDPAKLVYVISVSAAHQMDPDEDVILSSGDTTVTLPPVISALERRKVYTVKKVDTGGTTTTVNGGGVNIDGAASVAIATQYDRVRVVSDGTQFWRVD